MTERKWVYVVDHRSPRENQANSFANFIYPNQVEENTKGYLTAGTHGADFGELRALERSILDSQLDYGGVLHYRRALLLSEIDVEDIELFSTPEGHFVPLWSWVNSAALGWSDKKLFELSESQQTILPNAIDVTQIGAANLHDQYLKWHEPKTLLDLEKTWKGAPDFIKFLKSETKIIPFNMILTTKEIRANWFEWLMEIINPLEEPLSKLSIDPKEKRWPGYLAERLSTYYWREHLIKLEPKFTKTLRLDIAAELTTCPDISDYSKILKGLEKSFVLKMEFQTLVDALKQEIVQKEQELHNSIDQQQALQESLSWKLTEPIRKIARVFLA